jgi:2,3-bisphosphoglycerate-dependent phosphoglycerate mutase
MNSSKIFSKLGSKISKNLKIRINASRCERGVHTVVMIRHGESAWNVEKRFTGWCDIPLTEHGEQDAHDAGVLMKERGMKFDVAFTSSLERAWRSCAIALSAAGQSGSVETLRSWKLNERHYGALQGHLKDSPKLTEQYGEQKILDWRRSYDVAPPSLYDSQFAANMGPESLVRATATMNPLFLNDKTAPNFVANVTDSFVADANDSPTQYNLDDICDDNVYPTTESLKQCEDRAFGYWKDVIAPRVKAGDRVLIVAHANTIRALVKAVDQIDDSMIAHLKIPNGIPLVYTMDKNLNPVLDYTDDLGFQANYLVSARNHGKVKAVHFQENNLLLIHISLAIFITSVRICLNSFISFLFIR